MDKYAEKVILKKSTETLQKLILITQFKSIRKYKQGGKTAHLRQKKVNGEKKPHN